jgi:hypothetical protein
MGYINRIMFNEIMLLGLKGGGGVVSFQHEGGIRLKQNYQQ